MRISDWSSDVLLFRSDQIQIVEYSAHAACKRKCCAGKQQHRAIAETIDQPSDDGRTESEGEANHAAHQLAEENGIGIIGKGASQRGRSEEHTSELQSLMRISYAVFCLKKKKEQETKMRRK